MRPLGSRLIGLDVEVTVMTSRNVIEFAYIKVLFSEPLQNNTH